MTSTIFIIGQPERSKSLQYSLLRSLSDLQYQEDYHLPTTRKPWASSHIGHDSNRPLFDWGSVPQASGNSPLPNDKITATSYQTGIISVASGIPSSKSRNVIRQTDKEIRAPYFGPETRAAISTKKTNNRPRRKKMKPGKLASSNEKTTKSTPSYFNKALKFQHKTVVLSNDKSQKNIVISDPTLPPPFPERKIISNSAIHKVNNVDETKLSIMSGTKGISSSDNIMSRLNIGSTSSTTSLQASRVEFPKLLSTNPTKNLTQQKASVDNQYFLATNYSDMNIRNLDMSCGHNNTQNSSNNFLPAPKIGNGIVEVYRRRHNPEEPFNSYLEVLYTCKDGYHFKNALVHSLYCFQRKWIGELPSCISESAVKG